MVAPANNPFGKAELKYPVVWNFRIIAQAAKTDSVFAEVQQIISTCKVRKNLELTSKSKEGTYQTMTFSAELASHAEMEAIDARLKAVDGVKVVI
jgi:putative lipoic acid-binding regulatory protein